MPLLKTSSHVQNQDVQFSYPGSAGITQPRRDQLAHAKGSQYWHVRVPEAEALRLHKAFGLTFRHDSDEV